MRNGNTFNGGGGTDTVTTNNGGSLTIRDCTRHGSCITRGPLSCSGSLYLSRFSHARIGLGPHHFCIDRAYG